MSDTNAGEPEYTGIGRTGREDTPAEKLAAFDLLPVELRRFLNYAPVPFSAIELVSIIEWAKLDYIMDHARYKIDGAAPDWTPLLTDPDPFQET